MQIECRIANLGMAKQYLDGAQIGAGFQHVCREAVAKQMGRTALADKGPREGDWLAERLRKPCRSARPSPRSETGHFNFAVANAQKRHVDVRGRT
jgi:hypothetical protein